MLDCFEMMKQNNVFVAIFVLVCASTGGEACFKNNITYSNGIFKSGSPFYQECHCETPAKNLRWLDGNDQEIPVLKGPGTQLVYTEWADNSLNLYIRSLGKSLSGVYKCFTEVDGQRYAIAHEVVAYDPLIFFNTPITQSIIKGRNSLISCEVKADFVPRIDWMKGEYEITNSEKYEITQKGLVIKNVTLGDEGIYKCTVNVAGTGENVDRDIIVDMIIAPEIVNLVANPTAIIVAGNHLSLECRARGFPIPQYSWNKISDMAQESTTGKNITWRQEYNKIVFDNVTDGDRGTYECIARNDADETRKRITIEVLSPPTITEFKNLTVEEGTPANLTCKATGRPRPNILMVFEYEVDDKIPYETKNVSDTETEFTLNFLKVNRSYEGFYYCNASNEVDYVTEVIYMSVLYKPSFTKNVAHIWAWHGKEINMDCEHDSQPPANVTWRYLGNDDKMQSTELRFDMAQKNLLQNNSLTLRIAKNEYGAYVCTAKNHLGEANKTFVVKEACTPNEINNVTLEVTATSVTFSIEPPVVIGPALIGYTAEYDEERNYDITNIHLNRTWAVGICHKIDKLKPNTTYLIRFAGINEVGTGKFGKFFEFNTPDKSIPEPPSLEFDSNNKMLKLKSPENNGDPIDYYAIKYCRTDNEECIEQTIPHTNELKLDHLEHNATYRIEVMAHNSVGNSTAASMEITIPATEEISLAAEAQSAGVIIGISVIVVVACIVLLDVLLCATRRQGMIANCYYKKNKKRKQQGWRSRDKKGLLKENSESMAGDTMRRPDSGKESAYNRPTGIITGKHSSV